MPSENTAGAEPPAEVVAFAYDLSSTLGAECGSDLVGVYLHGSAVLGGFHPVASDVDVLAVIAKPVDPATPAKLGTVLAAAGGCPGAGLEMTSSPPRPLPIWVPVGSRCTSPPALTRDW